MELYTDERNDSKAMLNESIFTLSVCICMCIPCYAGYNGYIKATPTKVSEDVIKYDDYLLMRAKGALFDYHEQPITKLNVLIQCREILVNRYQEYKLMKKDNEFQIPRKYMELRMDEFFNCLQKMPPV